MDEVTQKWENFGFLPYFPNMVYDKPAMAMAYELAALILLGKTNDFKDKTIDTLAFPVLLRILKGKITNDVKATDLYGEVTSILYSLNDLVPIEVPEETKGLIDVEAAIIAEFCRSYEFKFLTLE